MRILNEILPLNQDVDIILEQDAEDKEMLNAHKLGQSTALLEDAIYRIQRALKANDLETCKKELQTYERPPYVK